MRNELTRLLRLAVGPLGDGEMDLLAGYGFRLVRLFQAISYHTRADVGVGDVGHTGRTPKRYRCVRRHSLRFALSLASVSR